MELHEYAALDATALAAAIAGGEVSQAEVLDVAAEAIDAVNPQLNALVGERFADPLAGDPSGPFAGVPFAIKDLVLAAEGVAQRAGTRMLGDGIPMPYDTALMARFRRAGVRTMALTATPEFGFCTTTESVANGPTRNPWDPTRSPGGSSGGSAALVAARAVPFAHANDGGGSIRIPAAACGLVGLKPSRGRTTTGPDHGDPLVGLGIEFAVTRTVRDSAALFDAVHGSEPGERYLLPEPALPWTESARRGTDGRRLRVAVWPRRWDGTPVDPACAAVTLEVARTLESMGHVVTEAKPEFDIALFDDLNGKVWGSYVADGIDGLSALLGVAPGPDVLEHSTLALLEYGRAVTAADTYAMERSFNAMQRSVARFLLDYDILVTPTLAKPNVAIGELDANDQTHTATGYIDAIFQYAPMTAIFNATGHPAISLPLGTSPEGWPVGVQVVAPYCDETTLFEVAGDLERAMPWAGRAPKVVAG